MATTPTPVSGVIKITGTKELIKKLKKIDDFRKLKPAMDAANLVLWARMGSYPPYNSAYRSGSRSFSRYRPGSSYQRTGTLGRSWKKKPVRVSKSGIRGGVQTNLSYAPFVQSSKWQAWMHKPWWITEEQATAQEEKYIVSLFEAAVNKLIP